MPTPQRLFVVLLALVVATAVGAAARAATNPSDYTIASSSFSAGGGTPAIFDHLLVQAAITPPPAENCELAPQLNFTPISSAGTTIWTDAASPNFAALTAGLTNMKNDLFCWFAGCPLDVCTAGGTIGTGGLGFDESEQNLFGAQVGLGGVDLAGYRIDRIGLRTDGLTITSPGSNPNGDGIWTDWSLQATFLFEGRIASTDACKDGNWQVLRGPGGSSFANQGQCVQFVLTGHV